jgi:hydroxymethylbilane synthase
MKSSVSFCRVGTRKSALARTQSQGIADQLQAGGLPCDLVEIVSEGDRDRVNPLYAIETDAPGLFCKQLEEALLADSIDIAVHSLKDLPTTQPEGLFVAAIPPRVGAADCLLVHPSRIAKGELLQLARGAHIGTSSLRREAQFLDARPDLHVSSLRGNVPSRVAQVREGKLDGAVLASAGLERLGLDLTGVVRIDLDPTCFVPAPGQGALAIEARTHCTLDLKERLAVLNHAPTQTAVRIERRIMRDLEGGCTLPLGVLCTPTSNGWQVHAFLGIAKNRGEARRDWVSFHRFDISGSREDTLVAETVQYLKGRK